MALSFPLSSVVGCCTSEIAVPWNESWALIELGLWSILSTAEVVNSPSLSLDGHDSFPLVPSYNAVSEFSRYRKQPVIRDAYSQLVKCFYKRLVPRGSMNFQCCIDG